LLLFVYTLNNNILCLVKLKGMNEHMAQVTLKNVNLEIQKAVFEIFNVARVITEEQNTFRYTFVNIITICSLMKQKQHD